MATQHRARQQVAAGLVQRHVVIPLLEPSAWRAALRKLAIDGKGHHQQIADRRREGLVTLAIPASIDVGIDVQPQADGTDNQQ
ncbi:hypothetical protein D3C71_1750960 [compost metagenome]